MGTTDENRAAMRPLVESIRTALNEMKGPIVTTFAGPWAVADGTWNGMKLTDGEVTLFCHTPWTQGAPKRLHITGDFPRGYSDVYGIPGDVHRESTVALTRKPKAAASQILPLIEEVREQTRFISKALAANDDAQNVRKAFLKELEGLGAKEATTWGNSDGKANNARVRVGEVYGDIEIGYQADSNALKLRSLSAEQVIAILAIIR